MKKLLCFLLCLTLIFSSVSLSFAAAADWSTTDQQNLQNISNRLYYNNYSAAYYLYQLVSHMSTIEGYIDQIVGFLQYGGHNITYWVNAISTWMSPILSAIQAVPLDLDQIIEAIYRDHPTISGQKINVLDDIGKGVGNYFAYNSTHDSTQARFNNHQALLDNYNGTYSFRSLNTDGSSVNRSYNWYQGSPIGNIALLMKENVNSLATGFTFLLQGFNSTQSAINWGNNQTSTFTPVTAIDGIYKWFSVIQAPVARLSYVLASDADINARESAAANQQAVVDNFIDSTGDGSASPSDIGSVSDLSSGYKQNFGTNASPSGIFDIFNADHASWFSQETKNQLDTTTPTRLTKGSQSETPLLDKQIEDIYNALGVKQP